MFEHGPDFSSRKEQEVFIPCKCCLTGVTTKNHMNLKLSSSFRFSGTIMCLKYIEHLLENMPQKTFCICSGLIVTMATDNDSYLNSVFGESCFTLYASCFTEKN